ncbi:MAG: hypothetical protein ACP5MH_11100 [Thermoproteus sp.]
MSSVGGLEDVLGEIEEYQEAAVAAAKSDKALENAAKTYRHLRYLVTEIARGRLAEQAMTERAPRWYSRAASEKIAEAVAEGVAEGLRGEELVRHVIETTGLAPSTVRHWFSELGEAELATIARRIERQRYGV